MVTFRYGFHKEAEGGSDEPGQKKERLLSIFGEWTDMVTDLIKATPEEDVLRRDIFDRPPVFKCADLAPNDCAWETSSHTQRLYVHVGLELQAISTRSMNTTGHTVAVTSHQASSEFRV